MSSDNTTQPPKEQPQKTSIDDTKSSVGENYEALYARLDKRLTELETKASTLEEWKDKIRDEISNSKTQLVETLGIFVALFTFISIEFQILKNLQDFYIGLTLTFILAGILLIFILAIDYVIRQNDPDNEEKHLFFRYLPLIALLLIALGLISYFVHPVQKDTNIDKSPKAQIQKVKPIPSISVAPTDPCYNKYK